MIREGITTKVNVVRIVDADTYEIEITRRVPVRLVSDKQDCKLIFDSPEKNTELGQKAIEFVKNLLANFEGEILLFVPSKESVDFTDIFSFNRILGEIWLDKRPLTDIMIENGFGRLIEQNKRKETPWD